MSNPDIRALLQSINDDIVANPHFASKDSIKTLQAKISQFAIDYADNPTQHRIAILEALATIHAGTTQRLAWLSSGKQSQLRIVISKILSEQLGCDFNNDPTLLAKLAKLDEYSTRKRDRVDAQTVSNANWRTYQYQPSSAEMYCGFKKQYHHHVSSLAYQDQVSASLKRSEIERRKQLKRKNIIESEQFDAEKRTFKAKIDELKARSSSVELVSHAESRKLGILSNK